MGAWCGEAVLSREYTAVRVATLAVREPTVLVSFALLAMRRVRVGWSEVGGYLAPAKAQSALLLSSIMVGE